jgi:proteasome accessory factor A
MRGFTADHLSRDESDAQFDLPGQVPKSAAEEHSDRILENGARLYNDHGHPEFSTPECAGLRDLVAHDRAGERILLECARNRMQKTGSSTQLYKNNTDYHGASYGCHENYLSFRSVPAESLIHGLIPFLVTRQLYAGAGKVGVEQDRATAQFQLSQRADFFNSLASVDTLNNRPLVNTRDEPHASAAKYRRLHVIPGDANMSEWAIAMKVGATSIVLSLLEEGWTPPVKLKDAPGAFRYISRDASLRWMIRLEDDKTISAIDVQRIYLEEAVRRFSGENEDIDWSLSEWEMVLEDMEKDILRAGDRVEWVAKRHLLEMYMQEENADWTSPVMQSLDLAWHNIDPDSGLFAGLEAAGQIRKIVTNAHIDHAMKNPPDDTRAFLRGLFVKKFSDVIYTIGWNGVGFHHGEEDFLFDMNSLVGPKTVKLCRAAADIDDLDQMMMLIRENSGIVND